MKVSDIAGVMEAWAPRDIAWEKDNVGLQIGNPSAAVRGIMVSLDTNQEVLEEARDRRANMIISHHPLLFRPPRTLVDSDPVAASVRVALRYEIAVYAAHTNMDFTAGGTSFALAELLDLKDTGFLHKPYRTKRKIVTYLPPAHANAVAESMASAGAGRIGNYDLCSFRTNGTGTFRGNKQTNPKVGRRGHLEQTEEVRLEMIANSWDVGTVVRAMLDAHPYEEPAYEVYPTENISSEYGMGVVGSLVRPQKPRDFLRFVKRCVGTPYLRCTGSMDRPVSRVAVCGGSGADLLDEAIRQGAEAFITADVKYHAFCHAGERILLIDAGHYETEVPVVEAIAGHLKRFMRKHRSAVPVHVSRKATNPIMYV